MKFSQWFSRGYRTVAVALVVAALGAQAVVAAPAAKSTAKPAAKPAAKKPAAKPAAKKPAAKPAASKVTANFPDDAAKNKPLAGKIVIPTDAASVAAGKPLYQKNCASCHGPNGEGNGPAGMMLDPKPRNYHTDKFKYGSDDAHIVTTVWLGAKHWAAAPPTSGMAGFKGRLSKEQVLQILAFVKHDFVGKK